MGSFRIDAPPPERVVVGVGDLAVSDVSGTTLTTYALGSCVGVLAYDPVIKAGGILHFILPDSSASAERAASQPAMFADTGLPLFFGALGGLHGEPGNIQICLAGGASVLNGHDPFRIGERNARAAIHWLHHHGYPIRQKHLGGVVNRTLELELDSGLISLKTPAGSRQYSLADSEDGADS